MAWVTPTVRTTGELITAAIWNQDVVSNPILLKTSISNDGTLWSGSVSSDAAVNFASYRNTSAGSAASSIVRFGDSVSADRVYLQSYNSTHATLANTFDINNRAAGSLRFLTSNALTWTINSTGVMEQSAGGSGTARSFSVRTYADVATAGSSDGVFIRALAIGTWTALGYLGSVLYMGGGHASSQWQAISFRANNTETMYMDTTGLAVGGSGVTPLASTRITTQIADGSYHWGIKNNAGTHKWGVDLTGSGTDLRFFDVVNSKARLTLEDGSATAGITVQNSASYVLTFVGTGTGYLYTDASGAALTSNNAFGSGTGNGAVYAHSSGTRLYDDAAYAEWSASGWIPSATNTYPLGSASVTWSRLFVDDGTNSAPSISIGDADTGFYLSSAGVIGITIDSSTVGLWTSTSSGTLEIGRLKSTSDATGSIGITGAAFGAAFINCTTTASAANVFMNSSTGEILRSTSSIRYKVDVRNYQPTMLRDRLMQLRPVVYKDKRLPGRDYLGLIAEEVAMVLPEIVEMGVDEHGNPRPESVMYDRLAVLLLAELQERA